MPGNHIVNYNAFPKVIQQIFFRRKNKDIQYISAVVSGRKNLFKTKLAWLSGPLRILEAIQKSPEAIDNIIASFGQNAKNFNANHKCTGWAACKKICPVDNVKMEENRPK